MKHPEGLRQGAPLFLLKDSKQCISLLAPLRHTPASVCSLLYKWAALKSSLQCRCQDFSCAFCKCCANFRIVRVCSTRPRLRQENICCKLKSGFCRPAWEAISITTIRRGIDKWSNVAHCVQQEIQRSRLWAEGHGISWHHMSVIKYQWHSVTTRVTEWPMLHYPATKMPMLPIPTGPTQHSVAGLVNAAMALSVAPSLSHPSPSPEFEASQPGTEISEISERFWESDGLFFPAMEWYGML